MLDADLADLYGVSTKVFNQAVRRNRDRFPGDFIFRLTEEEFDVNIAIMRAFVRMRRMLISHEELARKVDALERKFDVRFRVVFDANRA